MKASERFTEEARTELRAAIADALGNEVFVVGSLDEKGLVAGITVAARGKKDSVAALSGFLERGDVLIHNHPSGLLTPSDADISIASRSGEKGIGSYIVDNQVGEVYVVAEPIRSRPLIAIDENQLAGLLENGGKLAARLHGYEARTCQLELVRAVARAMNEGTILAAEAGTGVGKSFAYLIPAFAWAARNGERIVVSTATINLQKQLMDKDIPLVASVFKKKLKAVLIKGRGNYLCRARLLEALDEEGLFADDEHPLKRIAAWAGASLSGDKADLSFWPEDALWSRVCSEADNCLGLRCNFREECFVLKMKKDSSDADILVANHHILFSDLAARLGGAGYENTVVLPPFNIVIFDEAHAIESSATSFFSAELVKFAVFKQLSRLYREKRNRKFGLVTKLQNIQGIPHALFSQLPDAVDACRATADYLDDRAMSLLADSMNKRITEKTGELEECVFTPLGALERALLALVDLLEQVLKEIPDEKQKEQVVYEATLALRRLTDLASVCARFRSFEDESECVFWLERNRTNKDEYFVTFRITPLDIAAMMNSSVFEPYRTTVCVSATLSVGNSFEFWKRRTGLRLSEDRAQCVVFPSPFPFERTALLGAAEDAPFPESPLWQSYINGAVGDLIEAAGGHALVLFTSYQSLRLCWEAVKPRLDALGISAYRQGDDERSRLLESFKTNLSSVLFATDSFWEGIDAPGDTLQLVIITKLPFRVPTDPVQMARSEAIERRGGNSFMELSLPEAVIRFKQGFGRLIRHSEDTGAVVVLDARILKKHYGKLFLSSLPKTNTVFADIACLSAGVRTFLEKSRLGKK